MDDDNCSAVANATQRDTNTDGYGNVCDPDFDNNTVVGQSDLNNIKARWQCTTTMGCYDADVDSNGAIGQSDLNAVKAVWQGNVGPSGLACANTIPCP